MDAALGWIGQIASWFGQFFPRWVIIPATHGGVKFIRGHKIVPLNPGWHPFWPATTLLLTYPTARQGANLSIQDITTKDGRAVSVGGLIVYEIKNIEAILAHTWDPEQTIKDITLTAYFDTLVAMTWEEIQDGLEKGTLTTKLRQTARKELDRYGVKVLKCSITNLVQARAFRLIQSQSNDDM